jgi:diguanylate cyclase (GGDEF)-like protein/PAS domain S-box-containing protein
MSARHGAAGFGVWVGLLTVAFYAWPAGQMYVWAGIGVCSAAAIVVGMVVHRPRRRLPWVLLAAVVLLFCAGDTTYNVLTDVLGQDNPFPSLADVFYLSMYPLLAAALLLFVRYRSGGRDRGSLLDALTLTAGIALLSWIFLIVPYVHDPGLNLLEKLTSIAYPLCDVLCLATLARLLTASTRRAVSVTVLAVGSASLLITDVFYGLIQLNGSWQVGGPTDAGWAVFYAACGVAALHPSMTHLTRPADAAATEVTGRRLILLTSASLIAPAVLFGEKTVANTKVIAVLCAVMFLLVLSRLSGVVKTHRQAVARERGLRRAAAALVAAADVDEVTAAVRTAVAQLLPERADHAVALTIARAGQSIDRRKDWPGHRNAHLVATADLDPAVAVDLAGFPQALCCPLTLDDRPTGGPLAGTLHVAAPGWALRTLQGALEVLSSQAALALERITLADEVHRRNSEAYFRTLILNTADVILILDADDRIRYASPSAAAVLGSDALTGMPFAAIIDPVDRGRVGQMLAQMRDGLPRLEGTDVRAMGPDQESISVEIACRDLRAEPTVAGLVLTLRDVTERRRLEHELTHQAFHDALTGLANRVLFSDRVEHALTRGQRDGTLVGVLFIDLDDFKLVNDSLGHAAGDQLLVAAAQRITGALRAHDTAARLGGDEFAALIEDVDHPAEVEEIAGRVLNALAQPFLIHGEQISGVASIGITTSAEAGTAEDLLRQADLALYEAKGAGKGRWRRYQADLHTAMMQRLELRAALEQAVQQDQLVLQFQPILDLPTGHAVGFEALVRWQHPQRGMIAPAEFIELAEDTGLIVPVGAWVLRQALATAAQWRHTLPDDHALPYMAVNVSARQFRVPDFVDTVRQAIADSGLPPHTLLLEITESLLLKEDERVWTDLAELREIGVRIAIDDFGTGYSSLSYLRHMPIDILKIDKSFIDDMTSSAQQLALVAAIVRLADTLDLRVVAEGIETPAQADTLIRIGCPYAQGYLFSRPIDAADALGWLTHPQLIA